MSETLGKMRQWIQRNAINGSTVIWGSDQVLRFSKSLTVKDFEDFAIILSRDKEIDELKEYKWKYEALCR